MPFARVAIFSFLPFTLNVLLGHLFWENAFYFTKRKTSHRAPSSLGVLSFQVCRRCRKFSTVHLLSSTSCQAISTFFSKGQKSTSSKFSKMVSYYSIY